VELIGYARVSPLEQDPSLQHDAVAAAGCQQIFTDHASGALDERVEFARALDHLRVGDTLAEGPWCWAYVAAGGFSPPISASLSLGVSRSQASLRSRSRPSVIRRLMAV
jgi:Resolvase, N terminal domain